MPKKDYAPPVKEIRFGRVKALIWANETERAASPFSCDTRIRSRDVLDLRHEAAAATPQGAMHNVTFQRLYHDGREWQTTESFGRDDLPLLAKVADQAHTWIYENGSRQQAEEKAQAAA